MTAGRGRNKTAIRRSLDATKSSSQRRPGSTAANARAADGWVPAFAGTTSDGLKESERELVQRQRVLDMAEARRAGAAALPHVYRMQLALDVGAPEFEKAPQLGIIRREI